MRIGIFDITFEIQVGLELTEFMIEYNKNRDGFWVCRNDNNFIGCIIIDGRLVSSDGARLRWFIVTPEFQGRGIGHLLLHQALNFCEKKCYKKVIL